MEGYIAFRQGYPGKGDLEKTDAEIQADSEVDRRWQANSTLTNSWQANSNINRTTDGKQTVTLLLHRRQQTAPFQSPLASCYPFPLKKSLWFSVHSQFSPSFINHHSKLFWCHEGS